MLAYLLVAAASLIAVALAGIISDRHFVVIMLAVELIFLASIIALVSFFAYMQTPGGSGVVLLISIWSIAAAEIIALITFYVFMKSRGFDFDITKLSKLKW